MFLCTNCDAQAAKWEGRCSVCDKWGTIVEGVSSTLSLSKSKVELKKVAAAKTSRLVDVANAAHGKRLSTGDAETDRVLGGGVVPGSLILLSGEPGIGKSTLVAAWALKFEGSGDVLYVSGEESAAQLSGRFARLQGNANRLRTMELHPVETLVATFEKEKPTLIIVDSVQTLSSSQIDSAPGTPNMIRYAASLFLDLCKRTHIPILLVGQVTKDGSLAGPKTLEHLVDVVLSLEGDAAHAYRILRATKNRFGATGEIGVFEMTGVGLRAVENPSAKFLQERAAVPGSVLTATVQGSRVFVVEVQALVEKTNFGMPVRRASGFDQNRLQMLTAILSKRAGLKLGDQDIYVNVIGGLELTEPAADLAICAAIVSAQKNQALPPTLYVGEVGLGGEVRSVPLLEKRISEAKRLGIKNFATPETIKTVKDL